MQTKTNRILIVSPGTRETGVAVFEDEDLLYYATKDLGRFRRDNTTHSLAREAVRTVEDLIHQYQPGKVVMRRLRPMQRLSRTLLHLAAQIKAVARRRRLPFHEYESAIARKSLCPYQRATKRAASIKLAVIYPELLRYVADISIWQRLYYEPMFDAIAVGYVIQQEATRAHHRMLAVESDKHTPSTAANH